jgi:O-acetyl-ADP-ribose deacetylase (regulator of RNase III)
MSTAWYKPNRIPKRIRSWITSSSTSSSAISSSEIIITNQKKKKKKLQQQQHQQYQHSRSIEVWETTCIVTNMNYSPPPSSLPSSPSSSKNDTRSSSSSNNNDNDNNDNDNKNDNTKFSILINPGNPSLSGVSKFSYFPVGGPEPSDSYSNVNNEDHKDSHPIMGYVTQWGGMDVGNGMMFAANTIDGLVHQYGGTLLKIECQRVLALATTMKSQSQQKQRINEGTAIQTNVVGQKLIDISGYKKLIHTVPPFFHHHNHNHNDDNTHNNDNNNDDNDNDDVDFLLAECYRNSLKVAIMRSSSSSSTSSSPPLNNDNSTKNNLRIACPLLGAGCRGFPIDRAIRIAATTTIEWMMMINGNHNNNNSNNGNITTDTDNDTNTDDVTDKMMTDKNNTKKHMSSSSFSSSSSSSSAPWWWSPWRWFDGRREGEEEEGTKNDDNYEYKQPHSVTIAFGIPDGEIRQRLIEAIDQEMEKKETSSQ